jgi:6-pyruvoyltetrahydropterin/6-carboxytetrahydropterin synthase
MYRVTKEIHFCYGHRLLNHKGKCRHLHGHNAKAVVTLAAEKLDEQGMVMDFSDIKATISSWIESEIDHTMLMHPDDPFLSTIQAAGERVYVMANNPTAENIARLIFDFAKAQDFPVVDVTLWETDSACASYQAP